jgi:hypothetical protein
MLFFAHKYITDEVTIVFLQKDGGAKKPDDAVADAVALKEDTDPSTEKTSTGTGSDDQSSSNSPVNVTDDTVDSGMYYAVMQCFRFQWTNK